MSESNFRKLFGTDGIRGTANVEPMTVETVMQVGRATAYLFREQQEKYGSRNRTKILIGKDTRLSGYMVEMALASGICSMGVDVFLIGPMPTPGIAFLTQSMRCHAGIQISASHNPFFDNGIKIFGPDGFKLSDEKEQEIEKLVTTNEIDKIRPTADFVGKAYRIEDALGRYIVQVKNVFPKENDLNGIRIVLDCANGATYKCAPLVFEELGAEVIKFGVSPNGININDKCGALYPMNIATVTLEYRADIGIALDGDGDRVILTDEKGEVVNGDQILAICAFYLKEQNKLPNNKVIGTIMSNYGLEQGLKSRGIQLERTQVGDRYVVEQMIKHGAIIGGESSGHIIFLDYVTTGDGIIAALKVLEVMKKTGKRLSELKKCIQMYPQHIENVPVLTKDSSAIQKVYKLIEKYEKELEGHGRVVLRFSGTEPVCRVMVEGEEHTKVESLAKEIAKIVKKSLN
jgi:phosphoglucosamine mutase